MVSAVPLAFPFSLLAALVGGEFKKLDVLKAFWSDTFKPRMLAFALKRLLFLRIAAPSSSDSSPESSISLTGDGRPCGAGTWRRVCFCEDGVVPVVAVPVTPPRAPAPDCPVPDVAETASPFRAFSDFLPRGNIEFSTWRAAFTSCTFPQIRFTLVLHHGFHLIVYLTRRKKIIAWMSNQRQCS